MAQTAFSHFTYVFFSRGLAVVFFYLMDFSLSLFNCLNNAFEILLYAWLIGLNKVVHLILVIYLITDGFSPMVFIIHHIYFWRLNFEDFQNSPKLSVNDANVSYQRTRLWTPCNFMASLTILTVNIFWRLTSHLTIFFARTRIKVYNRSKWVEEIGKSIEHWADSALQLSIQRKDRRSPGNKGEWVSLPHNYISGARRA